MHAARCTGAASLCAHSCHPRSHFTACRLPHRFFVAPSHVLSCLSFTATTQRTAHVETLIRSLLDRTIAPPICLSSPAGHRLSCQRSLPFIAGPAVRAVATYIGAASCTPFPRPPELGRKSGWDSCDIQSRSPYHAGQPLEAWSGRVTRGRPSPHCICHPRQRRPSVPQASG